MQPLETVLEMEMTCTGTCNAVAFWFELQLDEETVISSSPDRGNVQFFMLMLHCFLTQEKQNHSECLL